MPKRRLPQSGRNVELEELSLRYLRRNLPPNWNLGRFDRDVGRDVVVEIYEGTQPAGLDFNVQVKGTDNILVQGEYVAHRCKMTTANYWLQLRTPTLYLVYDAPSDVGYYVWIQDYLERLQELDPEWQKRQSVLIRIPRGNKLTIESARDIARCVRRFWIFHSPFEVADEGVPTPFVVVRLESSTTTNTQKT